MRDCDSDSQPPRHSRVLAPSWATRLQPLATRAFSQGLDTVFPFSALGGRRPLHAWSVYVCERAGMALVTGGPFAAASLGEPHNLSASQFSLSGKWVC